MRFFVFVAIMAIAGCSDSGSPQPPYGSLQGAYWIDTQQALRVRIDTTRNRLWVLGLDHVDVYDIAERRLIRRIALPCAANDCTAALQVLIRP